MPVDWKSAENNERLLACVFASIDESNAKINYKRIAELFGQGTTANAIECNFRKIRAASKEVKEYEVNGGAPATATAMTPRKPKTPKKNPLSGVKAGRVEKPSSPTKKQAVATFKTEEMPTPPAEMPYAVMAGFDGVYGGHLGMGVDGGYDDEI